MSDAKLLADLNGARLAALAGREAARHWCPNLEGDFDSILKGIDAAIERCQLYVSSGWIPISERDPVDGDVVRVAGASHLNVDAQYKDKGFWAWRDEDEDWTYRLLHVTHWMPLPEHPSDMPEVRHWYQDAAEYLKCSTLALEGVSPEAIMAVQEYYIRRFQDMEKRRDISGSGR